MKLANRKKIDENVQLTMKKLLYIQRQQMRIIQDSGNMKLWRQSLTGDLGVNNTAKDFAMSFRENKPINTFIFHALKYSYLEEQDC